jgi:antitoxin (DNA-binding transcriptional repressor) of toxin-antitoxin stability system
MEYLMRASILDLRYNMKDVLAALNRNEPVTILYHGKERGTLIPNKTKTTKKVQEHAFFGIAKDNPVSVAKHMQALRSGRYNYILNR